MTITIIEDGETFLGLEFAIDSLGDVTLHQKKLISSMARKFGLLDSYPTCRPIKSYLPLATVCKAESPFRSMIGASVYVGRGTHPEISFSLGELSTHLACHDDTHEEAARYMIRYLIGAADQGIKFCADPTKKPIEVHADASFHGNKYDLKCRSRGGFIVRVYGVPWSWGSPLIRTPCLSSTDAELYALLLAVKRAYSLRKVMTSLLMFENGEDSTIYIHCDSQSAKAIVDNVFASPRTKYLDVPLAWLRDLVERKVLVVLPIKGALNDSDFFTKPFPTPGFRREAGKILNRIPQAVSTV